jgi:polar amino acid transport system permease protein
MTQAELTGLEMGWHPSERELERQAVRRRLRLQQIAIATVVTVVVAVGLVLLVLSSPGWDRVRDYFLSWSHARESFAAIAEGFWINIRIFLVAEPCVLVLGALVAIARQTTSPWLAPLRLLATGYTDLFRGVPSILVVVICGIGIPALGLSGVTSSLFWLTTFALVLCYGAYVAEVFRAGILAIHPTQVASAEALALTHSQTMRFVVLPQAVRRVVPAVGVFEALRAAQDYQGYNFNGTPLLVAAAYFLIVAVPLTRLTDWLMRRQIEKEQGR